ncbi:hypothetical protein ACIA98_16760 [Streptomyces sp. NPDC051366]|uniref:hypothetical protein n=1 Tax=Streptomyces sp. NPDC051366 TaxID=3365652 RepID=UPI0037A6A35F
MANLVPAGRTVHISEMFRLVRGTQHILDVLDVLHTSRLALRIHDAAFSPRSRRRTPARAMTGCEAPGAQPSPTS